MIEVEVKAGGHKVGELLIERIGGQMGTGYDQVFKYLAVLKWQMGNPASNRCVQVQHRYGDAWPLLVVTALKALIAEDIQAMIKREAPTLDEIAEQLQALKEKGVTPESLMYAAGQVWNDAN